MLSFTDLEATTKSSASSRVDLLCKWLEFEHFLSGFFIMLQRLAASGLGRQQAAAELRWMIQDIVRRRPVLAPSFDSTLLKNTLTSTEQHKLNRWVTYRIAGKPLQYILGTQPFLGREMKCRRPVLIPRDETANWTGQLIEVLQKYDSIATNKPLRVLDLGSGS